ncbi:MAG: site-specific DNA-methyltransferase [Candidatus Pacebacteria bacterium]|nr:site-specific DNA-methyltransferase [Candidatus Paceibacterota bacterium]
MNKIVCGDNLVLLRGLPDGLVDLCYIDPPFYSQRSYYGPKSARVEFSDQWHWDQTAVAASAELAQAAPALQGILAGIRAMVGEGGLLAYLSSLALRLVEIERVLKPNGSFYLHCDPTASHYLKLLCDAIFCAPPATGVFVNEIIWCYKSGGASISNFSRKHDVILFYAKSQRYCFNFATEKSYNRGLKPYRFQGVKEYKDEIGWYTMVGMRDYWLIDMVGRTARQRLGYPTQKPEALLERIITASSQPDDLVLDAYCGSGTTLAVAARLGRQWLGCDANPAAVAMARTRVGG